MNIILLSGGSGKRLWPLSNDARSKQFIRLLKNEEGEYESMLQRIYRQIKRIDRDATITIAAGSSQTSIIKNQMVDAADICIEPCRRDTYPAILLATLYLRDVKGVDENETVVVCPVDPYTGDDFFEAVLELSELARDERYRLALMGCTPTYPSEKYGYIIPESAGRISRVSCFKEKPDAVAAQQYIDQGGLWNCGVFAFRIKDIAAYADGMDYDAMLTQYGQMEPISFDYAVCEKEKDIQVLAYDGEWKDIGTWNTFTEVMPDDVVGDAMLDDTCTNVSIANQLDIPILAMGLSDVVIAASPDGILVADKGRSSYMKPYVDDMDAEVRYAEKTWGSYKVIDVTEESLTIKVTLEAGRSMKYHSHDRRDEVWTVTEGSGRTIVDGMEQSVAAGDVISIMAGCKHTIIADSHMTLIEVQLGRDIDVRDKIRHELE